MNVTVCSVLPHEVEQRLAQFLAAGKTGSIELHVNAGSIQSWKMIETGRVRLTDPAAGVS